MPAVQRYRSNPSGSSSVPAQFPLLQLLSLYTSRHYLKEFKKKKKNHLEASGLSVSPFYESKQNTHAKVLKVKLRSERVALPVSLDQGHSPSHSGM